MMFTYTLFDGTIKPQDRQGVVAIGNFDGVHRGHQALLAEGRALADRLGCAFHVLTFSPHPRRFFQPQAEPFLIAQPELKNQLLRQAGADHVLTLSFDDALSRLSATDFIQYILQDLLGARHIVVGQNFVFGHGRQGHVETLLAHGFDVTALSPVSTPDGLIYSSTAVRQALQCGDMPQAKNLLGRDWQMQGTVIQGQQRGRTINIPTANIAWPDDMIRPAFGVYAVTARLPGDKIYSGIANIGIRPTVDDTPAQPLLEAHLFDFDGDLYGQDIGVTIQTFIRPEQKFADFAALKAQIDRDINAVRAYNQSCQTGATV